MNQDQEIWSKFKNGDRAAFGNIYNKYAAGLLSYGKRFTSDEGIIEDCVHDLFVYLWKKKDTVADTDSISRYLMGAFRNNIIASIKKISKTSLSEEPVEENFDIKLSQESKLIKEESIEENKKLVHAAMDNLSKRQKEAIYLKFFKKMGNSEICEIMEINNQSLRNLVSTAIKRMQDFKNKSI